MKINEQIRSLRRERKMTQEQLAEAVGVSAAAVSKWESGQSVPEIGMMMALADYFEVSLDTLVGYEVRSRRRADMAEDIRRLTVAKKYEQAIQLAEESLRRYPNDFAIVRRSAELYCLRGMEQQQPRDLRRALELFDRVLALWAQNEDGALRQEEILHQKGVCCTCLGWDEQALRWFEQSNVMGVNNQQIASCLVGLGRYEKALQILSGQILKDVAATFNAVFDTAVCLLNLSRVKEAAELISWGLDVIRGLEATKGSYVFKMRALLCALAAVAALHQGDEAAARDDLGRALRCARRYDEQPDPAPTSIRFCYCPPEDAFHDNMGETATASVKKIVYGDEDERVGSLLREMYREAAKT